MEGGERRPQPYSVEYNWLGPDLTQNTRGQYIPILMVAFVMLTPSRHKTIYIYLLLNISCV